MRLQFVIPTNPLHRCRTATAKFDGMLGIAVTHVESLRAQSVRPCRGLISTYRPGRQAAMLSISQRLSLPRWQPKHALGLLAAPKRTVISASGFSSIWCERARNISESIFFGMWHETQRLPSLPAACRVCRSGFSRSALWHWVHISLESAANLRDLSLFAASSG